MNPEPTSRRALDRPIRPTLAEIRVDALAANLAEVKRLAPAAEVLAVVKANAYGHGAVQVARVLEGQGVRFLGVALVEEGIELRNAGVRSPILVLGGAYQGGYELLVQHQLTPTLFREDQLWELQRAAERAMVQAGAHLKVDTGMGRIGLLARELPGFLQAAKRAGAVRIEGLASHFANADLADAAITREQIRRFREALAQVREAGFDPTWRHLANSAGVLTLPEVRDGAELNLIRPGLMLYGVAPSPALAQAVSLQSVLTWRSGVIHLKRVPAGTPVSYGGTWVAQRESTIATLPVGYADGYSRHFSNRAQALVRGRRAPVAGRVCMDMCMLDVTDIPGVEVGDEVVLLGQQGTERITADELAQLAGTISYEVLCGVGARVPRVTRP